MNAIDISVLVQDNSVKEYINVEKQKMKRQYKERPESSDRFCWCCCHVALAPVAASAAANSANTLPLTQCLLRLSASLPALPSRLTSLQSLAVLKPAPVTR
jgi:hypothetical protein